MRFVPVRLSLFMQTHAIFVAKISCTNWLKSNAVEKWFHSKRRHATPIRPYSKLILSEHVRELFHIKFIAWGRSLSPSWHTLRVQAIRKIIMKSWMPLTVSSTRELHHQANNEIWNAIFETYQIQSQHFLSWACSYRAKNMFWTHFKWLELVRTVSKHFLNTIQMTWACFYCAYACFEYISTDLIWFLLCTCMFWTHFQWLWIRSYCA